MLIWLVVAPIPAALASGGGYSGNRAGGMLPVLQIIEAFGFFGWISLLTKLNIKFVKVIGLVVGLIFAFEIYGFVNAYFKIPDTSILKMEDYGSLQAAEWLTQNSNGKSVLVSRSLSEPQIFIAFAGKWDPVDFQKKTKSWNFDAANVPWVDQLPSYSLGEYTFKSIDWKKDIEGNTLIVVKAGELSGNQMPIKTINYPDGTPDIYILDANQIIYAKAN